MQMINFIYFFIGATIFCVDRLTKYLALFWLHNRPYKINSFISGDLVINRGVSWGLLHSESSNAFVFVSLLIVFVTLLICWQAYSLWCKNKFVVGYVCVITGSLSNIIDRMYYGGVIDFILLSYKNFYWPVFNVADIVIVGGILIILLQDETWT